MVLDYQIPFEKCENAEGVTVYFGVDPGLLRNTDTVNGVVATISTRVSGPPDLNSQSSWIDDVEIDVGMGRSISIPTHRLTLRMSYVPTLLQGQTAPNALTAFAFAGIYSRSSSSGGSPHARRTIQNIVMANGVSQPVAIPKLATSVLLVPMDASINLANYVIEQFQTTTQQITVGQTVAGGSRDSDAAPLLPDARAIAIRSINGAPDRTFSAVFILAL